jgi:hypothetical protein
MTAIGIAQPDGVHKVLKRAGNTSDIIALIIKADNGNERYTSDYSNSLKNLTKYEACKRIWHLLKDEVVYEMDPPGIQIIKSPAALWHLRRGDCKSYSLFTASILKNLGIPYEYRFAGYAGDINYKHVYVIALLPSGRKVIIDAVYDKFDAEKLYAFKKDMSTRIEYIGSTSSTDEIRVDLGSGDLGSMTEGQFYALLEVDRLRHNVDVAQKLGDRNAENQFKAMANSLQLLLQDEGIGCNCRMYAIPQEQINGLFDKLKDWVKNAGDKIKDFAEDVAGTALKVLSAPARLIVKGLLELVLPKAAPMFLYLYAPASARAKLNSNGQRKLAKAEKIKGFITKVIGMKGEHFDGIVKAGIQKRLGQSVEQIYASSIGFIPPVIAASMAKEAKGIIAALSELLGKLASIFGKKNDEPFGEDDLPGNDDWTDSTGNDSGTPPSTTTKDNTLLYVGLGLAAMYFISKKS